MGWTAVEAYDVVVIGAGHNGLVAASYLAQAGLRVVVYEGQREIGGAVQQVNVFGIKTTVGATWSGMFRPEIARDLRIQRFGEMDAPLDPQVLAMAEDGRVAGLFLNDRDTAMSIESYYGEPRLDTLHEIHRYEKLINRAAHFVESLFYYTSPAQRIEHLATASDEIKKFLMSSINEVFTHYNFPECLKSALAAGALSLTNSNTGKPGGGFALAYMATANTRGISGAWGKPYNGMYRLIEVLEATARRYGATVQTYSKVKQLLVDSTGRAVGVELIDGTVIRSNTIVACTHPSDLSAIIPGDRTSRELVGDQGVGSSGSVKLLLDDLPSPSEKVSASLPSRNNVLSALYVVTPETLLGLDNAFDQYQQNQGVSTPPLVTFSVSPVLGRGSACMMSCYVQFVNKNCPESMLVDCTIEAASRCFPEIRRHIVEARGWGPAMLEETLGLPGGHPEHLTMSYASLMEGRPYDWASDYRTPITGLYAGSAGWFPGGTVCGVPGRNVAHTVLSDHYEEGHLADGLGSAT